MITHTGEKPYKCKFFQLKNTMIKHTKKHIIVEKSCKYSLYDKTLSKIYLNPHIKMHKREKPHKCIYCEQVLSKNVVL